MQKPIYLSKYFRTIWASVWASAHFFHEQRPSALLKAYILAKFIDERCAQFDQVPIKRASTE